MSRILVLLIALTIAACTDNREAVLALENKTIAIHDEAMKEMASMNRVARELRSMLTEADSLGLSEARRDSIRDALLLMDKAEEDMMTWMGNYKSPADQPVDAALKYLEEQKLFIEKNFEDMKNAHEVGKKLRK